MKVETHTLKNRLRIVLAPIKGAESVTVMVMSGTGSRFESKEENGMAHFLEHMFFKGTAKRPTAKVIAEELDGIGGVFNAFTAEDHTAYYAKVAARHFETAFDVISDIFLNATLPAKEIERERGAVIEEINMYEDMPMADITTEYQALTFGKNHPLGRSILGPKQNIRTFTRTQFKHYLARNYVAKNSAVCITGSFSKTAAISAIRDRFSNSRDGEVPVCEPYSDTQNTPRVRVKDKKTDQTHVMLGVPAYGHHHDNEIAVEVLAAILGGGMSSRLFTQVRERRGLAYYVKADVEQFSDTGTVYARAGVSHRNLEKALEIMMAQLKLLTVRKVGASELAKAKEYLKGTTALTLDTTDALAQHIGHAVLVRGGVESRALFNKKVDAVKAADVTRVAKALFTTDKLNLAVIGPHKGKEEKLLKLLKI